MGEYKIEFSEANLMNNVLAATVKISKGEI